MKSLTAQGAEPTSDALYNAIMALEGNGNQGPASSETLEVKGDPSRVDELSAKLEKAVGRSSRLVAELDEAESRFRESEAFYRRCLLLFCELSRTNGETPLNRSVDRFRKLLKKGEEKEPLETAFQVVRDFAFKETPDEEKDAVAPEKRGAFWGRLLKRGGEVEKEGRVGEAGVKEIRGIYREIVDELRLFLGEAFLVRLARIGKTIEKAADVDDFIGVRKELLSMLQEYVTGVSSRQEKATLFIREISQRIMDVENYLLDSLEEVHKRDRSEKTFGMELDRQVESLDNSVNFSNSLDELKSAVVVRLTAIKEAISKKRELEKRLREDSDRKIGRLKKNLGALRKKATHATEQAKILQNELYEDPLTGAANRRAYDKRISDELKRYARYKKPFSAVIFDVDHFKKVNDNFGHAIGDRCLKEIIKRVKPILRECDLLARFGGEEFTVILPETESSGAAKVAEKLRRVVAGIEFIHKEERVNITISLGVTEVKATDETDESLFVRMDTALYEAKAGGRNRVVVRS